MEQLNNITLPVSNPAVGDPHLLSIQDPLVAFLFRPRFDSSHVRTGAGLSHTICLDNCNLCFNY